MHYSLNLDFNFFHPYLPNEFCININEDFRFKLNGSLGIVYEKGSGNLLAHNMSAEFHRLIGQDSMELYLKDQYYAKWNNKTA